VLTEVGVTVYEPVIRETEDKAKMRKRGFKLFFFLGTKKSFFGSFCSLT
jgi:hypothetical protein